MRVVTQYEETKWGALVDRFVAQSYPDMLAEAVRHTGLAALPFFLTAFLAIALTYWRAPLDRSCFHPIAIILIVSIAVSASTLLKYQEPKREFALVTADARLQAACGLVPSVLSPDGTLFTVPILTLRRKHGQSAAGRQRWLNAARLRRVHRRRTPPQTLA